MNLAPLFGLRLGTPRLALRVPDEAEMRTAVLEPAFGPLGAVAVTSSAFETNAASRRVSEKLGYAVVGRNAMSPRGVPQPHLLLRLEREQWRGAPFPVEIEGAKARLPLFGAS